MANKTRCGYPIFPFAHRFARLKTLSNYCTSSKTEYIIMMYISIYTLVQYIPIHFIKIIINWIAHTSTYFFLTRIITTV